jgi:hypothetical protein
VFAHWLGGQILGILVCVTLSSVLAFYRPGMAPIALIVGFMFQNLFVALISPLIDPADFNSIRAYDFLIAACVWAVCMGGYLAGAARLPGDARRLILLGTFALAVISVYFAIGLLGDAKSAAVYVRNIALAIMMTQIGLIIGYRNAPQIEPALQIIAYVVLAISVFEFCARDAWLDLTNGRAYWFLNTQPQRESGALVRDMMDSGVAFVDVKDFFLTDLFNTKLLSDLGVKVYRLNGPNEHSISFGYVLAFLMLAMFAHRRYLYCILAIPLLIAVSVKGALVLVSFTVVATIIARAWPSRWVMPGFGLLLAAYVGYAVVSGAAIGDYHVLGLFGGVNGFIANPLGRGVGAGGNLSPDFAAIDWRSAQRAGQLDVAAESAVGVLLYQIGAAAILLLGFYLALAGAAWREFRRGGVPVLAVCAFGIPVILANGFLQEEALFSPLALAMVTLYGSLKLGMLARRDAA